jgi:hypothetical protein
MGESLALDCLFRKCLDLLQSLRWDLNVFSELGVLKEVELESDGSDRLQLIHKLSAERARVIIICRACQR